MLLDNFSAVCFIKQLLEAQEYLRLGYNEVDVIYTHQFFDGIEWDDIDSKTAVPPFVVEVEKLPQFLIHTSIESLMRSGKGNLSRLSTGCHYMHQYTDSFSVWKHLSPQHAIDMFDYSGVQSNQYQKPSLDSIQNHAKIGMCLPTGTTAITPL